MIAGIRHWFFRSVCRLALMLGFFCFLEILFRLTGETTRPNYEFPWGHYDLTIGVIGSAMLAVAYFTWTKPLTDSSSEPAVSVEPKRNSAPKSTR